MRISIKYAQQCTYRLNMRSSAHKNEATQKSKKGNREKMQERVRKSEKIKVFDFCRSL